MNDDKSEKGSSTSANLSTNSNADWQRPVGVSSGTWDYVRSQTVATGYDDFLQDDPLTKLDWQIIDRNFPSLSTETAKRIVEFGCGTGRTLLPLSQRGYQTVGIDLSETMLNEFFVKVTASESAFSAEKKEHGLTSYLKANLVQLDGIRDDAFDHGVCLFSTLGMIRERKNRNQFLAHARRTIKNSGKFVLHAHSLWPQAFLPGGFRWFTKHGISAMRGQCEFGDRLAEYRSVKKMFIHSFRKRELKRDLQDHGFADQTWHYLSNADGELKVQESPSSLRTEVGWIIVAK